MLNKLKKISPLQWGAVILLALWLGFFNTFGQLYNGQEGTLAGSFTWGRLAGMGLATMIFFLLMVGFLIWQQVSGESGRPATQPSWLGAWLLNLLNQPLKLGLFILVVWFIFLLPFFPAVAGWDLVAQVREMTQVRSANPVDNIYNIYPVADYLSEKTRSMWTNQHGALLTAFYGLTLKYSWQLTHAYLLGYLVLGVSHFGFAVGVYTYALNCFNRVVATRWVKYLAFVLVVFNPVIVLSTISLSKNPLFATSFVLFLTLSYQFYRQKGVVSWHWVWLQLLAVTVGVIAVKWALALYAVLAVLLLLTYFRQGWRPILVAMVLPLVVIKGLTTVLIGTGAVIADDPVEAKGIQLQQIARYVQKYPNDISKDDYQQLNRLVDVANLGHLYDPSLVDPVKSSSYAKFTNGRDLGYRYQTVRLHDWRVFNRIWLTLFERHPLVYVDAFLAKSAGYFNLADRPYADTALTVYDDTVGQGYGPLQTGAHRLYHNRLRTVASQAFLNWFDRPKLGMVLHGNFWIVLSLLLLPLFLTKWSKFLLVLPVLLQIAIAVLSPVENSERYALGIIVAVPFLLLMLAQPTKSKTLTE